MSLVDDEALQHSRGKYPLQILKCTELMASLACYTSTRLRPFLRNVPFKVMTPYARGLSDGSLSQEYSVKDQSFRKVQIKKKSDIYIYAVQGLGWGGVCGCDMVSYVSGHIPIGE